MAYLIEQGERAGRGVERILREQNARILALLSTWESEPADAIHRARQTCKRARALAQLLKPEARYAAIVENGFFRDIQKRVAYARDAEALVEALDFLEIGVTEPTLAESVAMLRESLAVRAARTLEDTRPALRTQIDQACIELQRADDRLRRLALNGLRRRDIRSGADRTWSRCAEMYSLLQPDSPASDFHEWRRQVKYAYHQTQVLATMTPQQAMTVGPRLRELGALLGHGQDLELLEKLLEQQPDALGIDDHVQRLRQLIEDALGQLRRRSLEVGRDLFTASVGVTLTGVDLSVTERKQSGKWAATENAETASSRVRPTIPDRDPNPSRRWQSG